MMRRRSSVLGGRGRPGAAGGQAPGLGGRRGSVGGDGALPQGGAVGGPAPPHPDDEVDLDLIQNELANEALARAKSPVVLWRRSVKVRAASDVPERLLSQYVGDRCAGPLPTREELRHEIDVILGLDTLSPHLSASAAPSPHFASPSDFSDRARGQQTAAAAGRSSAGVAATPSASSSTSAAKCTPKKSPLRPRAQREGSVGRGRAGEEAATAGSPSPSRLNREGSELRLPPINSPTSSPRGAPTLADSPDGSSPASRKNKWKTVCNGPGYSKSPRSRYGAWYIPPEEWHTQEQNGGRSGDKGHKGHKGYGGDAAWIAKYELDLQRQMKDLYSSKVYRRYIQGRGEKLPHYLAATPKA